MRACCTSMMPASSSCLSPGRHTIGPGRRAQVGAAEFCLSQGHWCGEGSATCAAVPGPLRPALMAAARIDKVGFAILHLASLRTGEDLMRAFLNGMAVAAMGWGNGRMGAAGKEVVRGGKE